jgi:hypothetical protein
MVTRDELDAATARAAALQASTPRAIAARYDDHADKVVVTLANGVDVAFSPRDSQGLETAKPEELALVEITPSGYGLHFPKLDADLYVPAILEGLLGSRRWMAARLGALGGKSRTATKIAASRENGKLGGRGRKAASPEAKPKKVKAKAAKSAKNAKSARERRAARPHSAARSNAPRTR